MSKVVYLTIDDGPSNDFQMKVDFLLKNNILAILFCRGDSLSEHKEDVVYAIKKGFVIGNHAYDHSFFSKLTLEQCYEQILNTDKLIYQLYQLADVVRPMKMFRFPFGDKGGKNESDLQSFLKNQGFQQPLFNNIKYEWYLRNDVDVFWTFDTKDWGLIEDVPDIKSVDDVILRLKDENPVEGGSLLNSDSDDIILIHDHEQTTVEFFQIIYEMLKMDLEFKLPSFK